MLQQRYATNDINIKTTCLEKKLFPVFETYPVFIDRNNKRFTSKKLFYYRHVQNQYLSFYLQIYILPFVDMELKKTNICNKEMEKTKRKKTPHFIHLPVK